MALGDSSNPVSPKVTIIPLGALIGALALAVGQVLVDLVLMGDVHIPAPWDKLAFVVAGVIGSVIAAYRKTDGLRLPTINETEVAKLNPTPANES
jgi:hypothetical protein